MTQSLRERLGLTAEPGQKMYALFRELPVGTVYHRNGSNLKKMSSRTEHFLDYDRRFYARQNDLCIVALYSRLSLDYFAGGDQ